MAKKVMLKIANSSGEPGSGAVAEEKVLYSKNKPQIDLDLDIRDRLAELIGQGNNINADNRAAIFGDLQKKLGPEKAQKVMQHTYLFNSRPDVQNMPIEERLKSFYTVGSNDADVQGLINRSKSLGYGILPGFRNSSSNMNQELSGRIPVATTAQVNPDIQRKVMLKVTK